jgi:hypothetical protein
MTSEPGLVLAGRPLAPIDGIRRYCGLPWSGGHPQVWAYQYYDVVPFTGPGIGPIDVLAAAVLHPGLRRSDLTFFANHGGIVDSWLRGALEQLALADADDSTIDHLEELALWPGAPTLALLTKVLHRARPALMPLVDKHILEWYRPITGERMAREAWPRLLRAIASDAATNADSLDELADEVEKGTGLRPSALRIIDIAIWTAPVS